MDGFELPDYKLIISVVALLVAAWSFITSRKHNKLSVRPFLYESFEVDSISLRCRVILINKGLGPAIISESHYYLDDKEVSFDDLKNVVEKLPREFGIHLKDLKRGSAIAKDETHELIRIDWDKLKYEIPEYTEFKHLIAKDIQKFGAEIDRRFGFEIKYRSFYGEKGRVVSLSRELDGRFSSFLKVIKSFFIRKNESVLKVDSDDFSLKED